MTHVSKAMCAVLALTLFLAAPGLARAQSQATTAEINGRIVDAQGGVLPGVTVTATSPQTGYSRDTVSNAEGLFSLPLLPPGTYDVTAELSGFATYRQQGVRATVGATITLNPSMAVAGVQEVITVEAATPLVETSSSIRTNTVDEEAIRNLPINGRRFQDFLTLTPTAQVDTSRGQISFAGQRGVNSNVSIDGADYNQPFFGGIRGGERSNNAFTVPQEAIQEFQVVASGYSAEFGRSTGGIVNAITKSGTNTPRGSLFYVNRNKEWAERNAFGQNAAPTQQQWGGSIGGAITQNRLFFFAAGEMQRQKNTRNVVFALTGITPTADTAEAYNYFKGLEEPFDATNDAEAILGRIDYQMPEGNRLAARYSFSNNKALNANATGNALSDTTISALSNNGTERDRTHTLVGEFTSALRTNTLLEIRGQYAREERPRDANTLQPLLTGTVGNVGTVSFLGENIQRDWRAQVATNATFVKGNHSAKFGLEYNHVDASQKFGFDQFGTFQISGNAQTMLEVLSVGGPTANRFDAARSVVSYRKQIGNLTTALSTDELALFAQDAWRLASNFTFNYGLRWEGTFNPTPEANNDAILSQLDGRTFPIGKGIDPTQIPNQMGQFGPRVGFAWNPGGSANTVVRGYSGIYYARSPMLLFSDPMSGFRVPPGNLTVTLPYQVPATNPNQTLYQQLLLIGINLNQTPLDNLPRLTPDQLSALAVALGITPNPYLGVNVTGVDTEFKNPRATQVGGGVEKELITNFSAGADVVYVKTDHLERNRDLNIGVPTPRPTDPAQRPIFPARPLSTLAQVQIRESTAKSEYTAMTLSSRLRRNFALFNVNYVLSKSMSDDDNERDSGGVLYENAFNLDSEWGPARLDRRHQFNGYAVFFLPQNIDLSTGFRFLSGLPIDATIGRDINNSLGGADRPYSGPGVPFQRNAFRDEAFKEVNFRAQWGPRFGVDNRVMVTFDVFNVFNADNIRLSGTTVTNYCAGTAPDDCGFGPPTNPNFLKVKDANGNYITTNIPGAPRQVQLGLRVEF
jgi:hypothetical protein